MRFHKKQFFPDSNAKNPQSHMGSGFSSGADKRNRTVDLFITSESLYRLSYIGNHARRSIAQFPHLVKPQLCLPRANFPRAIPDRRTAPRKRYTEKDRVREPPRPVFLFVPGRPWCFSLDPAGPGRDAPPFHKLAAAAFVVAATTVITAAAAANQDDENDDPKAAVTAETIKTAHTYTSLRLK